MRAGTNWDVHVWFYRLLWGRGGRIGYEKKRYCEPADAPMTPRKSLHSSRLTHRQLGHMSAITSLAPPLPRSVVAVAVAASVCD